MSDFDKLLGEVEDGMSGKNSGIPMGFDRLNNHVSIRKSTYYLIGGYTGSGKTSIVDDAFVLNPLDYLMKHPDSAVDLKVLYFSMERKKNFKLAKWICRRIFLDTGRVIPVNKAMGWVNKEKVLTGEEYELFKSYRDYIDFLLSKVTIIEKPQNPTGSRKYVEEIYAPSIGELDKSKPYDHVFHTKFPNRITLIMKDHIGLQGKEKNLPTKKEVIDKGSEDAQRWRDTYNFSPIDVSQFNRDISNPTRLKMGDVEPMLEDFKDSGNTQENADVVLALFDPMRYKVDDPNGYDLTKLRDEFGRKKYRALKILKNSYGSDDIGIGLAFQPEIGLFKEMPKKKRDEILPDSTYMSIIDNSYFLK